MLGGAFGFSGALGRQPQFWLEPNHALPYGNRFAVLWSGAVDYEIVNHRAIGVVNGPVRIGTEAGKAWQFSAGSSQYLDLGAVLTANVSVSFGARIKHDNANQLAIATRSSSSSTGIDIVTGAGGVPGNVVPRIDNGTSTNPAAATGHNDGRFHHYSMMGLNVSPGSDHQFVAVYDGRLADSFVTSGINASATQNLYVARRGTTYFSGEVALVWAFEAFLPVPLVQEIHRNPWILFRKVPRRLYFAPAGTAAQDITATGIASLEAFGTARLDFDLIASAIATAEAFGTARLDLNLAASGIATAEAFGTARLDHIVGATGIASAEAFGTAQLNLEIVLAGVASGEAFGSHAVNLDTEQSITAAGNIASLEAFGAARLDFDLLAAAIASAEAFGTAQLDLNITATGIATAEAHGATTVELDTTQNVTPTGVASLEGFGTARLDFALLLSAASSGEAFGSHTVTGGASTFILTGRTFRDEGGRTFRATRKGRTIH